MTLARAGEASIILYEILRYQRGVVSNSLRSSLCYHSWDHPLVAKYKAEQEERTRARLESIEKRDQENMELEKQKFEKKKERMARRLSALNKRPIR